MSLLLPSGPHKRLRPLRPHDTGKRARLVTDYWVESCLAERNIQPTDARLRFTPVNFDVPLPGVKCPRIGINSTYYQTDPQRFLGCETLLFGKTNLMTSDWRDIEVLVLLIGASPVPLALKLALPNERTHLFSFLVDRRTIHSSLPRKHDTSHLRPQRRPGWEVRDGAQAGHPRCLS